MTESFNFLDKLTPSEGFLNTVKSLRRRFLRMLLALGIGVSVGLAFSADLLLIIITPFQQVMGPDRSLYFTGPSESFTAHLLVGLVVGMLLSAPYLFAEIWRLVAPVFYRRQRRRFMVFAMISALTFVVGSVFGYFGILPAAVDFLVRQFEIQYSFQAFLKIRPFLSFSLKLLLAFGLAFELPVLMFLIGRLGLVSARTLWRGFRYAIILIFVAAAIFTPPDVMTQFLLGIPLCLLYLVGVAAVALFGKRVLAAPESAAAAEDAGARNHDAVAKARVDLKNLPFK